MTPLAIRTMIVVLVSSLGVFFLTTGTAAGSDTNDGIVSAGPAPAIGTPLTAFVIASESAKTVQLVALATDRHVIPFTNMPPAWNALPPRSLQVQHMVLVLGVDSHTRGLNITAPGFLPATCEACWKQIQHEVNPEFAEKLTWEFAKLVALALPIPKTGAVLSVADLLTLVDVAKTYVSGGPEAARAKAVGWFASKTLSLAVKSRLDADDPFRMSVPYAAKVPGMLTEASLAPKTPAAADWAWRTTELSAGKISSQHSTIIWQSRVTDTFRSTLLHEGWTSERQSILTESFRTSPSRPSFSDLHIPNFQLSVGGPTNSDRWQMNTGDLPKFQPRSFGPDLPAFQPQPFKPDLPGWQPAYRPSYQPFSSRSPLPNIRPFVLKPDMPSFRPTPLTPDMPALRPRFGR